MSHTAEAKAAISRAQKARVRTDAECDRMSAARMRQSPEKRREIARLGGMARAAKLR